MFSIERSGYYAWLKRKPGKRQYPMRNWIKKLIIFKKHHSRYGQSELLMNYMIKAKHAVKIGVSKDEASWVASQGKEKI